MEKAFKHFLIVLFLLFIHIIPFVMNIILKEGNPCPASNYWCIGDILWSYFMFLSFIHKAYSMWVVIILYIIYFQYFKKYIINKNRVISSILYVFIILLLGLYIVPKESPNTYLMLVLLDIPISITLGYLLYKLIIYSFREKDSSSK
ncbi:MAG TPA: hypothetical protein DCF99_02475 [Flavobacteriaceae bacterium]|nr:hypothetical protein [Flavobacteriaceae bacterium]